MVVSHAQYWPRQPRKECPISVIDITLLLIGGTITLAGFVGMLHHGPYQEEQDQ